MIWLILLLCIEISSQTGITGICDPKSNDRICNKRGICKDLENNGYYVCICNDRYLGEYCEIEQKSRLTAFLLELFLGYFFGAGNLYLGRILSGVVKIALTIIMIVLIFYRPILNKDQSKNPEIEKRRLSFIVSMIAINLVLFTWWILDMIYIGAGYYTDSNGNWLYDDFSIKRI
ncbi:MAG: NINE protein [Spirochaetes bacterium]|nr:MAG: NINE protein [Spirochaetota bacterium]